MRKVSGIRQYHLDGEGGCRKVSDLYLHLEEVRVIELVGWRKVRPHRDKHVYLLRLELNRRVPVLVDQEMYDTIVQDKLYGG